MKILQVGGIIVATAITAACLTAMGKKLIAAPPSAVAESEVSEESSSYIVPFAMPDEPPKGEQLILSEEQSVPKGLETQPAKSEDSFSAQTKDQTRLQDDFSLHKQQARLEEDDDFSVLDYSRDATPPNSDTLYLSYYPYAELLPERKPADIVLDSLRTVAESEVSEESSSYIVPFAMPDEPPKGEQLILSEEQSVPKGLETQPAKSEDSFSAQTKDQTRLQDDFSLHKQQARLEEDDDFSVRDYSRDATPPNSDTLYLSYYPYAELPPERKPADIVLDSLRNVQIGTPLEEIKRASDAFGLDFSFMRTVAKIESDFDPKQRTGSYISLFQLSKYEFAKYGSGEITSPRDNAIAAAYKFVTEARLFEWDTHKEPTFSYRYLIHQQGWQGAAEHVSQPDRVAWKSMCATDEGKEKGEKWCKRAIWQNTLPAIKHVWKSVDKLPSGAFVDMWRERVDRLYARYSEAVPKESNH